VALTSIKNSKYKSELRPYRRRGFKERIISGGKSIFWESDKRPITTMMHERDISGRFESIRIRLGAGGMIVFYTRVME